MFQVLQTDVFAKWLLRLRDPRAKARIVSRVDALRQGHFGDVKHLGDGLAEMRIHVGPGYRVYFVRHESTVVILLCGGDKDSQDRDILRARALAADAT